MYILFIITSIIYMYILIIITSIINISMFILIQIFGSIEFYRYIHKELYQSIMVVVNPYCICIGIQTIQIFGIYRY